MRRLAAACVLAGLVALGASLVAPLRAQGGDTVPGRLGAAALRCSGTLDLREIDWLRGRADAGRLPYYARRGLDDSIVSTFGPAPAVLGSLAFVASAGSAVDDRALATSARRAAALALACAAALLALAIGATASPIAALGGSLTAALSFAGAATLGQGLWQQTAMLPLLSGAIAALAWGVRAASGRILPLALVPGLAAAAVMVRPGALGLAIGIVAAWFVAAVRPGKGRVLALGLGAALAAACTLPFAAWNLSSLGTWLPMGQLAANQGQAPGGRVFDPTFSHVLEGVAGLLASPGRGVLFHAPIVILAILALTRRGPPARRALAFGLTLHLLVVAAFFKWWGGLCFGPRLLAEAVWVAAWIVFAFPPRRLAALSTAFAALTVLVGLAGLWRYDPRRWEIRRDPDRHPAALWDWIDSPLRALLDAQPKGPLLLDAPPGPFRYCAPRALTDP